MRCQLPLHLNEPPSRGLIPRIVDKINIYLNTILSDSNSRKLFFFLLLNLSFAFVELFYGIWTNSLGLISDAFHMFFDCTGLMAGLAATIITRWRATDQFSYGYVRAEIIAGLVNGLFLLFIAFFILSEAVERAIEPPEVKHERLFIVSVLGFCVNMIGIFAFQHGHGHGGSHGHSHGGGAHGHRPGGRTHAHAHGNYGHFPEPAPQNSHIMKGVFLHILADTLGSVGVIISSLLVQKYGWMRADPICSLFIAVMIIGSVLPLINDSILILMQRQPVQLDNVLPQCYQRVMQLVGVYSIQQPHFWTLSTDNYVGAIKLEVSRDAEPRYIISNTQLIFSNVGVRQMYVQLDYATM